jgi:hypothetical protein
LVVTEGCMVRSEVRRPLKGACDSPWPYAIHRGA